MDRPTAIEMPVRQVEAAFNVAIRPPSFQLGHRWADFQSAIFARLSPFGLRLGDIKVDAPTGNPADFSVACWILGFSAAVRYRFDRIEAWTNSLPLLADLSHIAGIVTAAVGVAQDLDISSSLSAQTIVINVHAEAPPTFVKSKLRDLTSQALVDSPGLVPSGIAFTADVSGVTNSIIFEPSRQIADGLFLRLNADYGPSVNEADAIACASQFLEDFARRIGVALIWDRR